MALDRSKVDWQLVRYLLFMQQARNRGDYQTLKTLCDLAERKFGPVRCKAIEKALLKLG